MDEIEKKLEELSLLLAMMSPEDEEGFDLILTVLNETMDLAQQEDNSGSPGDFKAFAETIAEIIEAKGMISAEKYLSLLEQFTNRGRKFVDDPSSFEFPEIEQITEIDSANERETSTDDKESTSCSHDDNFVEEAYAITGEVEILSELITEIDEHLTSIEDILLEEGEYGKDTLNTIFRSVHSIKGGSAYFNLLDITESSHILETLMDLVRGGEVAFTDDIRSLILEYTGLIRELIEDIKQVSDGDGKLIRKLDAHEFRTRVKELLDSFESGEVDKEKILQHSDKEKPSDNDKKEIRGDKKTQIKEVADSSAKSSSCRGKQQSKALKHKTFIKVDTEKLDVLIDSIGEMLIYSSMLIRACRERFSSDEFILKTCHQVEKYSRDLQDIGMSMRLIPIKGLFQKMSRLVWDTSKKLGKKVSVLIEGEDTEIDRNLIEKLADPIMHMVRNSIDHGIETPEERQKNGKAVEGTVRLSANNSGGTITITIEDDGKGIDPKRILEKAVEKGIVSPEENLSEQEIYQLIFAPGFSTAAQVTDISGRGVGMDVVRRNIEALRGEVNVFSEVGKGTRFEIDIPLTLAIMDGIEVRVGHERFILPTTSVIEFLRPDPSNIITEFGVCELYHFREEVVPIYRLANAYNIEVETDLVNSTFAICSTGKETICLAVDEILGQCQTVIKSLDDTVGDRRGISGSAVMSNGEVALILDVRGLNDLLKETYNFRASHRPNRSECESTLVN